MKAATIFLAVIVCASGSAARAETYRNDTYRYAITLPDGLAHCAPGAADHGPGVYLDGKPEGPHDKCAILPTRRVMAFWAEYNTIPLDLAAYAHDLCKAHKGDKLAMLRVLNFHPHNSSACRIRHKNGWVEYDVLTQAAVRAPGDKPDIFYGGWLYTRHPSQAADVRTFKAVLRSLKLVDPN